MATVSDPSSQHKLFPLQIELSSVQFPSASELDEALKSIGFDFELKDNTMVLKAVPSGLQEDEAKNIILELLDDQLNDRPDDGFSLMDVLARSLAVKMAIKTGHKLSITEQRNLINELFACKEPDRAPDQRRTFITLDMNDLEQKFT
jgi:DNA mismatch repair protein MutL